MATLDFDTSKRFDLPLWDSRWGKPALVREYQADPRSFNRGYRQLAYTDSERTFPHWSSLLVTGQTFQQLFRQQNPAFYGGMDISGDKRPGTVMVTVAVLPDSGKRVICEIRAGAWTTPHVMKELDASYLKWKHTVFNVENNAAQQAVVDWAQLSNLQIPIKGFTTGTNKSHPELGLPGMEVELHNGTWMLLMDEPYNTEVPLREHYADCRCAYHRFLLEVAEHPHYSTSDTVMAWWFAREAARSSQLMIYAA